MKLWGKKAAVFLAMALFPCFTAGEEVRFRDFEIVADRIHAEFSGRDADDVEQRRRASELDPEVASLLDMQNRDRVSPLFGALEEVKRRDAQDINSARRYFDPVRTLAQAFSLPASRYYQERELLEAIERALTYNSKHVYPGCERPGNWWVWGKQMPDCLAEILGLMNGKLRQEDESYLRSVFEDLVGTGPIVVSAEGGPRQTGKVGKDALSKFIVGVLTRSHETVEHARNGMMEHVVPYLIEEDGIPLITVIFKENLGISLPYMYEGFRPVITWQRLAGGTSLELEPRALAPIVEYCLELGRWNTFRGTEVGWISFTAYRVFWQPAVSREIAALVADAGSGQSEELRTFAEGRDTPLEGARYWPNAETLIFRPPDTYCALVMASEGKHRISWSYKNRHQGIGNKWYYGRDGHLVIARNEQEIDPRLTYTWDWRRLSGVTRDNGSVLRSRQLEKKADGYWQPEWLLCRNPMAGAVTLDNRDAVAGIEVVSGELRARKSYYFLKDEQAIVALTSHVEGEGSTETIVHTFPVTEISEIVVNGERRIPEDGETMWIKTPCWLHVEGAGYYFPDEGEVGVVSYVRKPDFEDYPLSEEKRFQIKPQRFVTLFFDHGENPTDASGASVILLDTPVDRMSAVAKRFRDGAEIERTDAGHHFGLDAFSGQVFFRAGSVGTWEASGPCILAEQSGVTGAHGELFNPDWGGEPAKIMSVSGREIGRSGVFEVEVEAGQSRQF